LIRALLDHDYFSELGGSNLSWQAKRYDQFDFFATTISFHTTFLISGHLDMSNAIKGRAASMEELNHGATKDFLDICDIFFCLGFRD